MNKLRFFGIAVILTLASCERSEKDTDRDNKHETDPEVFFQTGEGLAYRFNDFDFYDSSTCIFYFKTTHEEWEDLELGSFTFLDNGDTIYTGSLWPAYMNSMPFGPFISAPLSMYGNYALRIENWWHEGKPDPRNCPEMITVLKEHDLLHSGLALSIDAVDISADTLNFSFTVTNADTTDLLILDLNKMGPALYHYFTNGLYLYDTDHHEVFTGTIAHQAPVPWNSWKSDWLSDLGSGDSVSYTIRYPIDSPLEPGEYQALFEFPGLAYQVGKDQLYQGDARIWLGDVQGIQNVVIP
jgi:hypothetical protein